MIELSELETARQMQLEKMIDLAGELMRDIASIAAESHKNSAKTFFSAALFMQRLTKARSFADLLEVQNDHSHAAFVEMQAAAEQLSRLLTGISDGTVAAIAYDHRRRRRNLRNGPALQAWSVDGERENLAYLRRYARQILNEAV